MIRMHTHRGAHPLWIALAATLSLAVGLLITAGVGQAQADEQKNFCWGKHLEFHGSCSSATYPDMWAVYGSSPDGSVCVSMSNDERLSCAKGKGEGVYLGKRKGDSGQGYAQLINLAPVQGGLDVYGTFWRKSWHPDNLGGTLTADPDLASWGENRLDAFIRGTGPDNALWHRWWGGSGWGAWEYMGGELASGPSAVSWGYNRIDVVSRLKNGSIGHWYWDGGSWKFDNMGGLTGNFAGDLAISSWGPNRLDVFARGATSNKLWHAYWDGISWKGWEEVGVGLTASPAAVSWGPGRIDVVATVAEGKIGHWYWDDVSPGWKFGELGSGFIGDPDITSTEPGKLFVYARDSQGYIRQHSYSSDIQPAGSGWMGWAKVGGPVATGPTAESWSQYRIDVAAGNPSNSSLDHWWWQD